MIELVGIIGGGIMGSGIAEVAARSGCDVVLREVDMAAAEAAQGRIGSVAGQGRAQRQAAADEREAADGSASPTDFDELADRDLMIEAVIEDGRPRRRSSPPGQGRAAGRTPRQQHVVDPDHEAGGGDAQPAARHRHALLQPGPGAAARRAGAELLTSQETVERAERVRREAARQDHIAAQGQGRIRRQRAADPVPAGRDPDGGAGFASPEDIDTGMVAGCAHPMGPLALTDLIGLDTTMAVAEVDVRGDQGAAVRPAAAVAADGRGGRCSAARPAAGFFSYR